jgi:hypothetical protein
MISRRLVFFTSLVATAVSFFTLGVLQTRRGDALSRRGYEARIQEIRDELRRQSETVAAGTSGTVARAQGDGEESLPASRTQMMAEIKEELQQEMGLLPVHLLRDRRPSFVELYADDNFGKTNYGTAGYLGGGYFVTVKHAVVALKDDDNRQGTRKMTSIRIVYHGKEIPARVVDHGDAEVEVDKGDWAIIKTRDLDLPVLNVDTSFSYDFAEPIFRLGNDYSKGIVVSTGYVGQKTGNGLITALADGHPGVSGGGVLDQRGDLVGIPIGRMQGDYRFSFILPMRGEMLRKVPGYRHADAVVVATAIQ